MRSILALSAAMAILAACGQKPGSAGSSTSSDPQYKLVGGKWTSTTPPIVAGPNKACAALTGAYPVSPGPKADIIGIPLGASTSQVMSQLSCANKAYQTFYADTYEHAEWPQNAPRPHDGILARIDGPNAATGGKPLDEMEFHFIGVRGEEKLESIERDLWPAGIVAAKDFEDKLIEKYGPTTISEGQLQQMVWRYDPEGRPMSPENPNYQHCMFLAGPTFVQMTNPACGLTITAEVVVNDKTAVPSVEEALISIVNPSMVATDVDELNARIKASSKPTAGTPAL